MPERETGLTAEDHAYRHAADAYFTEKSVLARGSFDATLLDTFLSFESHWRAFFAPPDETPQREYLAMPFEVRKAQFERFRRQCRAWEISFSLYPPSGNGNGDETRSDPGLDNLKKRLEEQRSRTERVRAFYDNLDSLIDRERNRRAHPLELLPHLRILELSADATLADVKSSYRRLARVHHPDVSGDARQMSRLNNAYGAILAFYNRVA